MKETKLGQRVDDISTQIMFAALLEPIGLMNGLHGMLDDVAGRDWTSLGSLANGGSVTVTIVGRLMPNTENEYQGDVSTFTIKFKLVQVGQTP